MSTDVVDRSARALARAEQLLRVLDVEHDSAQLHQAARSVRYEVQTARDLLSQLGADIPAPREGVARGDAPETSKAAARAIRTRSGGQRHRLLKLLADQGPLADFEMQAVTGITGNSQRPRRIEMARAGYVTQLVPVPTNGPVTRKNPATGQACEVWTITDLGRAALRKLAAGQMVLALPIGEDA